MRAQGWASPEQFWQKRGCQEWSSPPGLSQAFTSLGCLYPALPGHSPGSRTPGTQRPPARLDPGPQGRTRISSPPTVLGKAPRGDPPAPHLGIRPTPHVAKRAAGHQELVGNFLLLVKLNAQVLRLRQGRHLLPNRGTALAPPSADKTSRSRAGVVDAKMPLQHHLQNTLPVAYLTTLSWKHE